MLPVVTPTKISALNGAAFEKPRETAWDAPPWKRSSWTGASVAEFWTSVTATPWIAGVVRDVEPAVVVLGELKDAATLRDGRGIAAPRAGALGDVERDGAGAGQRDLVEIRALLRDRPGGAVVPAGLHRVGGVAGIGEGGREVQAPGALRVREEGRRDRLVPTRGEGQALVSRFAAPWSTSSVLTRAEAGPAATRQGPQPARLMQWPRRRGEEAWIGAYMDSRACLVRAWLCLTLGVGTGCRETPRRGLEQAVRRREVISRRAGRSVPAR